MNHGWKKRVIEQVTCPSGAEVSIRRPGPEFTLKAGRIAKTFTRALSRKVEDEEDGLTEDQRGLKVIANMTDAELAEVMEFARTVVTSMLVYPKLVKHARGDDEIEPDDVPDLDFWYLFGLAMKGFGAPIPVGNTEVEVADLVTFRGESGVSGDSADGEVVQPETEQPVGNQGSMDSAGD